MITSLEQVTEFPLCWPPDKPRAAKRLNSTKFTTSRAKAVAEISAEMNMWRGARFVVSTAPSYRQGPIDPGVAVWFSLPPAAGSKERELRVLACDTWTWAAPNLHAIYLTLKGMRAFERYGTYTKEQAAQGARLALPPPTSEEGPPWWETLGVERAWPLAAIEAVYRTKAEKAHPDRTGDGGEAMARINAAMDAARKEHAA